MHVAATMQCFDVALVAVVVLVRGPIGLEPFDLSAQLRQRFATFSSACRFQSSPEASARSSSSRASARYLSAVSPTTHGPRLYPKMENI